MKIKFMTVTVEQDTPPPQQGRRLERGECGYDGGAEPDVHEVQLRTGRNRRDVLRVPCGGGFRVIRKRIGGGD